MKKDSTVIQEDDRSCMVLDRCEGKFLTYKHISLKYRYLNGEVLGN